MTRRLATLETTRKAVSVAQFSGSAMWKVWIGGRFLVELMSPAQAVAYTAAFGRKGIATLDGRLRDGERASVKSIG